MKKTIRERIASVKGPRDIHVIRAPRKSKRFDVRGVNRKTVEKDSFDEPDYTYAEISE